MRRDDQSSGRSWRKHKRDTWGDVFDMVTALSLLEWQPGARPAKNSPSLYLYEQAHRQGSYAAVYDAIRFCGGHWLPMPEWLTKTVLEIIRHVARRQPGGDRGRHARWERRYLDDMQHLNRWVAVEQARGRPPGYAPRYHPQQTLEEARRLAAERLETPLSVIVESHQRIQKLRRSRAVFRLYRARN